MRQIETYGVGSKEAESIRREWVYVVERACSYFLSRLAR